MSKKLSNEFWEEFLKFTSWGDKKRIVTGWDLFFTSLILVIVLLSAILIGRF